MKRTNIQHTDGRPVPPACSAVHEDSTVYEPWETSRGDPETSFNVKPECVHTIVVRFKV